MMKHTLDYGPWFFAALVALSAPACSRLGEDCEKTLCGNDGAGAAGGGGGAGGAGPCDATLAPSEDGCVLTDALGIFVRQEGDDAAPGTLAQPVATLGRALALASAQSKRVYACAQSFDESIVVPSGIAIYGGLDCATDWSFAASKTGVAPSAADTIPITLQAPGLTDPTVATRLHDLAALAPDALAEGGSSIALMAPVGVTAELFRVDLTAGNAAAGADGMDAAATPAGAGPQGNTGGSWDCTGTVANGATQKANPSCTASIGGAGGPGGTGTAAGNVGIHGAPDLASLVTGLGGPGQPVSGNWNCPSGFMDGKVGGSGNAGSGATGMGSLSVMGYQGATGGNGQNGVVGQGGGGGGGARLPSSCGGTGRGAGGGSGGAGGCAGVAGMGGSAGGSSFALVSLDATLTLTDCTLTASAGGDGGGGGDGQLGGAGGPGGSGGPGGFGSPGCTGGNGGAGGDGGPGGGGQGGHSAAMAHVGSAPMTTSVSMVTGNAGLAGPGGAGGETSAAGDAGVKQDVLAF